MEVVIPKGNRVIGIFWILDIIWKMKILKGLFKGRGVNMEMLSLEEVHG